MSKQDSQKPKKKTYKPGYLRDVNSSDSAIETIVAGLRAQYEKGGSLASHPMPSDTKLYVMAKERYQSSIANGCDDHLGTAKRKSALICNA